LEVAYKNGEKHGVSTEWHKNGQLKSTENYKDGSYGKHGKWTQRHDNGQISSEGYYKNDDQVGEWTYWYDNGQTKEEINFNNGESTSWYSSGKLKSKGSYFNGSTVVSRQYNKQGKWTYWYEGGQKKSEEYYKDAAQDGEWVEWYKDGQLKSQTNYKARSVGWRNLYNLHGKWTEWYADGQIKSEANYKNGEKHGKRAKWSQDGQLKSETHFRSGYEKGLVNTIKHNRMPLTAAILALVLVVIRLRFGSKYMGMWIGVAANALVIAFAIFNEIEFIAGFTLIVGLMVCCMIHGFRTKPAYYLGFLVLLYIIACVASLGALFMCALYGLGATGGGLQGCSW
jgi:antitoxin component YwqK of YwqJK toxin-antitoxin module